MHCLHLKIATVAGLLLLSACGGSSNSSDQGGVPEQELDTEMPTASITFPARGGLWSDRERLVIYGSASDNQGVESVTVNGIEASSDDGFATWQAGIALTAGTATEIEVAVTDVNGNHIVKAASTEVNSYEQFDSYSFCGPLAYDAARNLGYIFNPLTELDLTVGTETRLDNTLGEVSAATYDAAAGHFLVIQNDNLLSLNKQFNETGVISTSQGAAVEFGRYPQIGIDSASGFIYVLNPWSSYLVKVDPVTGEREEVGGWELEDGSTVYDANYGFSVDSGRFFVVTEKSLIELNPITSSATEISGPNVGLGAVFVRLSGLSVDLEIGKAYVGDAESKLFEVDLTTGNRTLLSSAAAGAEMNLSFASLRHGFIDTGSFILINSCLHGKSFAIDKSRGYRDFRSDTVRGAGPLITEFQSAAFDRFYERILVLNNIYRGVLAISSYQESVTQIVAIDPDIGDRKILGTPSNDAAENPRNFKDIAVDSRNGSIFVTDVISDAVVHINPETGNNTLVSSAEKGMGPDFISVRGLAVDEVRNRLLVLGYISGEGDVLIAVDIQSGNRTLLTGKGAVGTNEWWDSPSYIDVDQSSGLAYVVDYTGAVFRVDLDTGLKTLVSGRGIGDGPELDELANVALDRMHNRLLVENFKDRKNDEQPLNVELLAIDLETGNREFLLNWEQRNSERMLVVPVVDDHTGEIYLSLPNLSMAVFNTDSRQYLTISR